MQKTIKLRLNNRSIQNAKKELEKYKKDLLHKTETFVQRLCDEGINTINAQLTGVPSFFANADDIEVTPQIDTQGNIVSATISISGEQILFIEFGAGIRYSSNTHPLSEDFGYGAGTYPGKGHWDDPNGWWYKDEKTGKSEHSYGNPAIMPAYWGATAIKLKIVKIAKEVFK